MSGFYPDSTISENLAINEAGRTWWDGTIVLAEFGLSAGRPPTGSRWVIEHAREHATCTLATAPATVWAWFRRRAAPKTPCPSG